MCRDRCQEQACSQDVWRQEACKKFQVSLGRCKSRYDDADDDDDDDDDGNGMGAYEIAAQESPSLGRSERFSGFCVVVVVVVVKVGARLCI